MKTPIGIDKLTDEIRLIDDVVSGLKCNCICPSCKAPLVARKGEKKAHHFSHHKCAEQQACRETAIHLMAKYVIKQLKKIKFPEILVSSKKRKSILNETINDEIIYFKDLQSIYNTQEEVYINQNKIQPDILCKTDILGHSEEIAIEVVVTHKIDDKKLKKIKTAELSTFEIDLSDLTTEESITFELIEKSLSELRRLSWAYLSPQIEEKLKNNLQIKIDNKLEKRNKAITEWSRSVEHFFLNKGNIDTPKYPISQTITDPYIRTIDGKQTKLALPKQPNLEQSYLIISVEDLSKGVLNLKVRYRTEIHQLPIVIHLPSTTRICPKGSFLVLNADSLPKAEDLEGKLEWGSSVKVENYIKKVTQLKKQKKDELDAPIKAKVHKNMEWLRRIRNQEVVPTFPNINKIHHDYLKAKNELEKKGLSPDDYTTNLSDGWILGCPSEYWQVILMRMICRIDHPLVTAKFYANNLNKNNYISAIEPVRSLMFMKSAIRIMDYRSEEVPSTFGVLLEYFRHLDTKNFIKWNGNGVYQKLMPFGPEYKAL